MQPSANPILIIRFPEYLVDGKRNVPDVMNDIEEHCKYKMNNEYHVFAVLNSEDRKRYFDFECFNHNLSEIDLEDLKQKLYKDFTDHQHKTSAEDQSPVDGTAGAS